MNWWNRDPVGHLIEGPSAYLEAFPERVRKSALDHAHEIRRFEINLYWTRATYFWTLIAAAFAGYFLIEKEAKEADPLSLMTVGCLGLVLSYAWFLVNRGSKYWQENWERHVDALEDSISGPLYKTTLSPSKMRAMAVGAFYPYSVSRVNQYVSGYVTAIWLLLLIRASFAIDVVTAPLDARIEAGGLLVLTFGFLATLYHGAKSKPVGADREVRFRRSALSGSAKRRSLLSFRDFLFLLVAGAGLITIWLWRYVRVKL